MTLRTPRILESITRVDAAQWNALAGPGQPFVRHEFLAALEQSGAASPRSGWQPRHLLLEDAARRPMAALPLYGKMNSRGEFVFDFSWANAYTQHGLSYYPKLVSAVPFTPVSGPRLLLHPAAPPGTRAALIEAGLEYARSEGVSSWHVLFPDDAAGDALEAVGMVARRDCQFHWFNQQYTSFEHFLAGFTAEKRKKAKRERRRVAEAGILFDTRHGADMDDALWKTVYAFYADTFYRHGHDPYLGLQFFRRIAAALPEAVMLKIARLKGEPIAAAIFFVGSDALFGRYWGAGGNYHSLHFETCYYQGIEYCIERGLKRFEPGTQGEHKVPRGFVPAITRSAHYIADPRFAAAIRDFAKREASGVAHYAAAVNEHVPYNAGTMQELEL